MKPGEVWTAVAFAVVMLLSFWLVNELEKDCEIRGGTFRAYAGCVSEPSAK